MNSPRSVAWLVAISLPLSGIAACTAETSDAPSPDAGADASTPDATRDSSSDAFDASSVSDGGATDSGMDVTSTSLDGSNGDASEAGLLKTTVAGVVQKGPFVLGSSVTVQELDSKLTPTGKSFNVTTTDNEGNFSVPVNVSSQYVEVIATGYYFDELTNQLSASPLTLRALADLTSSATVNVNLLTSMSGPLVRNLVAQGATFSTASSQAETSVLGAVGLSGALGTSFSDLTLTGSAATSADLLAASLIIEQYARSLGTSEVAQLALILAQVGAAAADAGSGDATLNALNALLCVTAASIDTAAVRSNLTGYYAGVGATVSIPAFEPIIAAAAQCAACVPPAAQCGDGGVQTCTRTGSWSATIACDAGLTCIAGACTGLCNPGQAQCSGNSIETCNDAGQWNAETPCTNQACASGACVGVCAPAATECADAGADAAAVETCDDGGSWGPPIACPSGQSCTSGACSGPPCTPAGATRCTAPNAVQTCDSAGHWGTPVTCANQACSSGACVGVCSPGSTQCNGGLQTCGSGGQWGTPVACPNGCASGACLP